MQRTHMINLCKVSREMYFDLEIHNIKIIAKMLWYNSGRTRSNISRYLKSDGCSKCTGRKEKILW